MGWGVFRKADPQLETPLLPGNDLPLGSLAPVELGMHGSTVGPPSPWLCPPWPCTMLRWEGRWQRVWALGWAYRAEPPGGQRGGSSEQIWQGRWQEYGRPHPSFAGCPSALQATTWWPESSITPKLGRGPHV